MPTPDGVGTLFVLDPKLIEVCSANHARLCPRQVLGLRIGLLGAKRLGLEAPRSDKRLLTIVETDGCFADGVATASGCSVGRRTMYIADYGKAAATFVDVQTGESVRIAPRAGVRKAAWGYVTGVPASRWHAQLEGYQVMPDDELLSAQPVRLAFSLEALIGQAGKRVTCDVCGEEIINQREVLREGQVLCRACAGRSYYALPGGEPFQEARFGLLLDDE